MLFNSYTFILLFLPVAVLLFYGALRHSSRSAIVVLALASIVFYGWWDLRFVPILFVSIAVNYGFGRAIAGCVDAGDRVAGKRFLIAAIVLNLGALAYFKYVVFFLDVLASTLALDLPKPHVLLPLGISFFTFTQITFLVDGLAGKAREYSVPRYALFVTYFPHLIAGPILHHSEMMPQFILLDWRRIDFARIAAGLGIFSLGLFKKVILADSFAPYAEALFHSAQLHVSFGTLEAWAGSLAYYFQLYFDFSGYSDMAVGLSLLFGVRLPLNFDSPYRSTSIIEFWRRWHITLSRFLRDYLYIPLGGNRRGTTRRYVNLMLTMVLGGLWHGAGYTFLIWGALHGAYLVINHLWLHVVRERPALQRLQASHSGFVLAWCLTTLAVLVAWVFFRAESLPSALSILHVMVDPGHLVLPLQLQGILGPRFTYGQGWLAGSGDPLTLLTLLTVGFLVVWFLPNTVATFARFDPVIGQQPLEGGWRRVPRWRPSLGWALLLAFTFALAFSRITHASKFLYFNF